MGGRVGSGEYWIQDNFIYGPKMSGEFWISNSFIYGPANQDSPWL